MTQKRRQIYLLQNYSVCSFATVICFESCSIDLMLLLLFWGEGVRSLDPKTLISLNTGTSSAALCSPILNYAPNIDHSYQIPDLTWTINSYSPMVSNHSIPDKTPTEIKTSTTAPTYVGHIWGPLREGGGGSYVPSLNLNMVVSQFEGRRIRPCSVDI